ncbi:hypothetical protein QBC43DRAFT_284969 [Cladorrhinum sp. PSN259]|nr:hypothetical protein QBC43DRAFT_284969 [Cladorrhinum sp. PSN259]
MWENLNGAQKDGIYAGIILYAISLPFAAAGIFGSLFSKTQRRGTDGFVLTLRFLGLALLTLTWPVVLTFMILGSLGYYGVPLLLKACCGTPGRTCCGIDCARGPVPGDEESGNARSGVRGESGSGRVAGGAGGQQGERHGGPDKNEEMELPTYQEATQETGR